MTAIAGNERVPGDLVEALAPDEIERRRDLEHMPAETGIVEVDDAQAPALDEYVLRHEIGVDQPEAVRGRAEVGELPADPGAQMLKQRALPGAQGLQLPESAPEGNLTGQPPGAPRVSLELCGRLPLAGLVVHSC